MAAGRKKNEMARSRLFSWTYQGLVFTVVSLIVGVYVDQRREDRYVRKASTERNIDINERDIGRSNRELRMAIKRMSERLQASENQPDSTGKATDVPS